MRTVTVAWMFGVVWMSCVSGSQFATYCRAIGFADWHFGISAALPYVGTLGQILAVVLIERTGLRKYQFLHTQILGRSLWLAVAAIPLLLPVPSDAAVWSVMAVLLAIYLMDALSSPAWLTWMGHLIPRRIRGRYFARRTQWSQVVQVVVVLAVGITVDRLGAATGATGTFTPTTLLYGICVILAIGSVFGVTDPMLFHRIREVLPPAYNRNDVPILRLLVEPFKNRLFRYYVVYWTAFTFTMTVAAWYWWLCAIELLGFSKLAINILFLVVVPLTGIVSSGWWGKAIDRFGRKPILVIAGAGSVINIIPWLIASPNLPNSASLVTAINGVAGVVGSLAGHGDWTWVDIHTPTTSYMICLGATIVGGVAGTGIGLAQTSIVLGFSDGQGRSTYIAVASILSSVGGIFGGLFGGYLAKLLEHLHGDPIRWGPLLWNNWHVLFAIVVATRALTLLLLWRMPDPGATMTRDVLRVVRSNISNNVMSVLFYPLRIFGWKR